MYCIIAFLDIAETLGWVKGRLDFSGNSSIFPSPVIPNLGTLRCSTLHPIQRSIYPKNDLDILLWMMQRQHRPWLPLTGFHRSVTVLAAEAFLLRAPSSPIDRLTNDHRQMKTTAAPACTLLNCSLLDKKLQTDIKQPSRSSHGAEIDLRNTLL